MKGFNDKLKWLVIVPFPGYKAAKEKSILILINSVSNIQQWFDTNVSMYDFLAHTGLLQGEMVMDFNGLAFMECISWSRLWALTCCIAVLLGADKLWGAQCCRSRCHRRIWGGQLIINYRAPQCSTLNKLIHFLFKLPLLCFHFMMGLSTFTSCNFFFFFYLMSLFRTVSLSHPPQLSANHMHTTSSAGEPVVVMVIGTGANIFFLCPPPPS